MNVAMILAGGRGTRLGAEIPKQYIEVLGKPVLAYTLETFQHSPKIDAIQVVCQPEFNDRVERIAREYGIDKLKWITAGGDSCPTSIENGVRALRGALSDDDMLMVHMGINPLVTLEDIASALSVAAEHGCSYTMHPVFVCMAQRGTGAGDWADTDAPKEGFIELNAPWTFRYGEVCRLYDDFEADGHTVTATDYTLNLWFAAGRRAYYYRGSEVGRLKITTMHDLDMFEGYLRLQEHRRKRS